MGSSDQPGGYRQDSAHPPGFHSGSGDRERLPDLRTDVRYRRRKEDHRSETESAAGPIFLASIKVGALPADCWRAIPDCYQLRGFTLARDMPYRVLLVEDLKIMRDGIRALLDRSSEFIVVGDVETGPEAV